MAAIHIANAPSQNSLQKKIPTIIFALSIITLGLISLIMWYVRLPVGQGLTNDTILEPLVGAERAVVELNVGAGRLKVQAGTVEQMLEGRVQTLTGIEKLERTATTAQGNAMVYRLDAHAPLAVREPARWPQWNLNINPDIPLELTIRGGMGESNLDLSKLNLDSFNLTTDAGKYTVTFPRTGDVKAKVTSGLSHTRLLIPEGGAVRLEVIRTGQGHVDFNGRIYRTNSTYISDTYDTAPHHLDLTVTSSLSHVYIETIP
jgi:N-terminal domain of toast_rack, DUF2154